MGSLATRLFKTTWAIAALWFPVQFARTFVPEAIKRLEAAEYGDGIFSLMASDFWMAGTYFVNVYEVTAIGVATTSPFWFVITKRWRLCWLVTVTLPLAWFTVYGLRMRYQWGSWITGVDSFEWWIFLVIAAWPLILLGYGYAELFRRLLKMVWRRFSKKGQGQQVRK